METGLIGNLSYKQQILTLRASPPLVALFKALSLTVFNKNCAQMTFHSFLNIFLNIKRIFAVARNRTHAMTFSWAQITLGISISGLYQHFSSGTHFPREGPQLSGLNPERLGQKRERYLCAMPFSIRMPSPLIILILFVVTWQGIILLSLIFTTSRFFVQHR